MTFVRKAAALGIAALAAAIACGGESTQTREEQGSGGSAPSKGGSAGVVTGGSAGAVTGGRSGSSGTTGSNGGSGGSVAGGSSGIGGAGSSAGGVAGLPPPPVPLGVFGDVIDRLIVARANAIQSLCCLAHCCDDPEDLTGPIACLDEEYFIFVPSAGWLACASRVAATDAGVSTFLSMQADCYESCARAGWQRECGSVEGAPTCNDCGSTPEPMALEVCLSEGSFDACPSGPLDEKTLYGLVCNGADECADGFDERNCDPAARSFRCASGESVPWLFLCDGTSTCPDASDEFACFPPPF